MKNIKAILFDIDGTLLNTEEFIFRSYENTVSLYNLPTLNRKDIRKVLGKPLEECYALLLPGQKSNIKKFCKNHNEFQLKNPQLVSLYPNVKRVLQTLGKKSLKLAAITTRGRLSCEKSLDLSGIKKYFDIIIYKEDVKNPKPHPESLLKVLSSLRVPANNAIMVGDTDADILAGKNTGVSTIGVTYGFHGEKIKLANPDFIIADLSEILPLLKRSFRI